MSGVLRQRYMAEVADAADPEKRGRIKVKCQDLLPGKDALPQWCEPSFPYTGEADAGWFYVPGVGTIVEIEITVGSTWDDAPGQSGMIDLDPRWVACTYKDTKDVAEDFRKHYGQSLGIKTPKGQMLLFDDQLKIAVLLYGKIYLGAYDASENMVLGQVTKDLWSDVLDAIAKHKHVGIPSHVHQVVCAAPGVTVTSLVATSGDTTDVPTNVSDFTSKKASPVEDGKILSDHAFVAK